MQVPLEINFHNTRSSDKLRSQIEERAARLDHLYSNLISCRTVLDRPSHQHNGNGWRVKVELLMPPRHELVVIKDTSEHPEDSQDSAGVVIDDAFDSLEAQLKKAIAKQKGEVKLHTPQHATAVIESLVEDHGFLREGPPLRGAAGGATEGEGRLIYFHRNSLVGPSSFGELTVGTKVEFAEEQGAEGPQARFVSVTALSVATR